PPADGAVESTAAANVIAVVVADLQLDLGVSGCDRGARLVCRSLRGCDADDVRLREFGVRLTTQHPKQWEIHGRGQSVMDRDVDSGLDRWVAPQGAVHALMQLRRIEDGEPLQTWKEHMAQGGICPFEGLTRDMGVRNRFAPSLDALVSDDPQQNRGHVIEP